ncbi:MAG TPA: hypothetical protein VHB23_14700 [Devosiaceae bacterium]|nr:hypothetical protein [Devosiaceae bacterium]
MVALTLLADFVAGEMSRSITAGVADTAAASLDVLIADELAEIGPRRPLKQEDISDLDTVFSAANDTRINKLIQIRLRNPDGTLLYQSLGGIEDPTSPPEALAAARAGRVSAEVVDLGLAPVGPLPTGSLTVLKVITPIHDRSSGAVQATAELYFSAGDLMELERRSGWRTWTSGAAIGAVAIAALFMLVDRAGRTIARQRRELAENLATSERLAEQNARLRQEANVANERLLARVGSDLHDGPLQLLTLLILKLSRRQSPAGGETALAQQAMAELRNISAGLVLPELSTLSLADTIALAIRRHEQATGTTVETCLAPLPTDCAADLKVCLYRTVQEGLANARRHGQPGTARLSAAAAGGWVEIEISNDCGEETANAVAAPRPRLGLDGMRARLDAIGGRLEFAIEGGRARLKVGAPI